MGLVVVEEVGDGAGDVADRRLLAGGDHRHPPGDEGGGEEVLLGAEAQVKGLHGDVGPLGDLGQLDLLVGPRGELLPGRGQQALAGLLGGARAGRHPVGPLCAAVLFLGGLGAEFIFV